MPFPQQIPEVGTISGFRLAVIIMRMTLEFLLDADIQPGSILFIPTVGPPVVISGVARTISPFISF